MEVQYKNLFSPEKKPNIDPLISVSRKKVNQLRTIFCRHYNDDNHQPANAITLRFYSVFYLDVLSKEVATAGTVDCISEGNVVSLKKISSGGAIIADVKTGDSIF